MKGTPNPNQITTLSSRNNTTDFKSLDRHIMRQRAVSDATGYGRSSIYKMMKEGRFPQARRLGPRAIGWDSQEIQAWIDSRLDGGASA